MIKVYDSTEKIFNNNGIKILKPLFAQITKKDNSDYYLELEDTINNINYYQKGLIIRTTTPWGVQGFRCDNPKIENNRIKCKAWHLTYDSKNYIVKDSNSVDKNCSAALYHFNSGTDTPSPFTTISDIETILSCRMVRKSLFQVFNELIDKTKYGGHLYRDNFVFGIKSSIGEDRGVVLATNKNITGMSVNENWDDVCTKILPYTTDGQKVIALDDVYVSLTEQLYDLPYSKVVKFENPYKEEDYDDRNSFEVAVKTWLKSTAMTYLEKNKLPKVNYTVEAQINNVSDVGDVIRVKHSKCNIDIITNVISITYDCIRSKYVKIEFGNFKKEIKNLTQQITEEAQKYSDGLVLESNTYMKNELLAATSKINAVLGNSFVIYDGDKILIVNKLPKEEATDVIKISNGGIGFSRDGINGTFKSAWTIDGNFCADFITTGKINTNLIEGYSNLELAVQNSLLSITPQYSIEGTDIWSDTIPNVDTWQRILTRNKYVRTDGKITYSKVIPYVEGMNNLINYIEGTDVSIYNSNDDEMELKSIVLDGKSTQETRSGKNIFNKNAPFKSNGSTKEVLDTGVRAKLINSGNYRYLSITLGKSELLGKTITLTRTITNSASNIGQIALYFGNETSQSKKIIFANKESGASNIFIPNTFPEECDRLWILFYGNVAGTGNVGDYTDYTNLMITVGDTLENYEDYGVSPSPDYPSEIECVKGKNLFDGIFELGIINGTTGQNETNNNYIRNKNYIPVEELTDYKFSSIDFTGSVNIYEYKADFSYNLTTNKQINLLNYFTTNKDTKYIRFRPASATTNLNLRFQLEKGTVATDYLPYNTIQVKDVGKNLYKYGDISDTVSNNYFVNHKLLDNFENNTTYTISLDITSTVQPFRISIGYGNDGFQKEMVNGTIPNVNNGHISFTFTTNDTTYSNLWIRAPRYTTPTTYTTAVSNIMLEKGIQATTYEPYQENITNIDLQGNELCSLPNKVKDELVIENGKVKIIKNVGKYDITGNEAWALSSTESQPYINFSNYVNDCKYPATTTELPNLLSNYYLQITRNNLYDSHITLSPGKALIIYDTVHNTSLASFKEWLKSASVVVYYELAAPTKIDLNEEQLEITKLFSKENNITNSEHTNMLVGYYTDYTFYKTVLEQYAKIDLNNDNINIELAKKTNSKDIIATINMSTEKDEDGSVIQINSDKLNLKNKVFNLDTENITIKSPNFNVDKNGNIEVNNGSFKGNIYLPSGGYVLGGNGLLTVLKFESNIRSAQFLGANNFLPLYYSGANNTKDFLEFDFDIPDNFTILSAYVKLEHMPVNHNEISSGSLGTGYCRNLKLYKAKSMTSGSVDMNWSFGSTGYSNIEFNEITGAFGSNGFTGSLSGYTSQKSIDLKAYISTGNNIFKIETSDGFTQGDYSKYGAARATLYVYGYTNVS